MSNSPSYVTQATPTSRWREVSPPTHGEREEDRLRREQDLQEVSQEERSRQLVHKAGLENYEVLQQRDGVVDGPPYNSCVATTVPPVCV